METIEALMTRRSVRTWTEEAVPMQERKLILEAAMNAPSAANARPWQFVTIDDAAVIARFTQMGGTEMLAACSFLTLVCGEPGKEVYPGFWPQDCSCAAHNMQIAAHARGIGCVWIGIYPLEARVELCRAVLGIPEDRVPFALLAFGYPKLLPEPEYRYDATRIHANQW